MAVIELQGLRKEFRSARGARTVALDGVDLEVPAGGVFGFLGPNGAGKTTTIRCLLGLVRPSAGRCRVLGADPWTQPARLQRRVGALVEGQALFPAFSGRRNLSHLARLHGLPAARVGDVLERVGLGARADDPVRTYSSGMRQRVGLAAVLLKEPEVLVLDEPANGLDPEGIVEVRALLRRLGDEGRTVFVSSHQLAEVEQLCDRVAVLVQGRCVASGTVHDVLAVAGAGRVVVRVGDPGTAAAVLAAEGLQATIRDGALEVDVDPSAASRVARVLARHDIFPDELRPGGASLEDAFLRLTRPAEGDTG